VVVVRSFVPLDPEGYLERVLDDLDEDFYVWLCACVYQLCFV